MFSRISYTGSMGIVINLFLVVLAACVGGVIAKVLKVPSLVGYILAGILAGVILPESLKSVSQLAEVGTILLLFSIGVELSLGKLVKFVKVGVIGGIIQIVLVSAVSVLILLAFNVSLLPAIILALGFSLSSTAVCVKILNDKGELDTIHGGVMVSWLLVQDLAVIPMMVILPLLGGDLNGGIALVVAGLLAKALLVVVGTLILGRLIVPYIIHFVAAVNSRELLLLASVALAMGTAAITSYFGISAALGAFLAGIVISESQEHHAIFAETRPLRDLFVALFFVTLGFLVDPSVVASNILLIIGLTAVTIVLKAIVVFVISVAFGYKGRTAVAASFGLAQVGEFAFVIFSTALALKIIDFKDVTVGIAVTLLSLIVSPILFGLVLPVWRKLKNLSTNTPFYKLFSTGEKKDLASEALVDHIIICGFGRVGKWVGKALTEFGIPFVVIEYNQSVVNELKEGGISVLYGDPTEPEVLEAVGIRNAKAIILAIPDRIAQETLIAYTQSVAPNVKIISRVHQDTDWEKLKTLRVDKVVQPEFEAALEIIRSVLTNRGKSKDEVMDLVRGLRVSHSR